MLRNCASGFGAVALSALLNDRAFAADTVPTPGGSPMAARASHFPAKCRNVIFLYMDGGPSQVDTFDPKPMLTRDHGQPFKMKMEPTQFANNGNTLGSPWAFKPGGTCGTPVSDLFPHVRELMDDIAVVRSMTSAFSEHTNANYFLHTGSGLQGRPSMGAWFTYGLGSECQNLPGFVVLNGGLIPPGGLDNFNSGFLPASYQGSVFKPAKQPVANVTPLEARPELQRGKLALMNKLDAGAAQRMGKQDALESAIANYELAFRMQSAVPELMDLTGESAATKTLYGLDATYDKTRTFGLECLIARRLIERGVRFIELTVPNTGNDRWDQHKELKKGHEQNSAAVDQPIAGLLKDLKSRGLLSSTLVVFAGEFGRTPFAQGADGRDHNPFGFSVWMAGGGVKGGTVYGATDDYGYKAVDGKCQIHDLHATMLHLLGLDHKKVTYRWGGRDMRLTDVHGELITPILA
ncbi:DUF1501 domain-containing protein [Humisphaera borealis]|uniref:DUF1501 domain-containing protein n=1 Tax=Humisphaera borealis TaxID=2807512 RepID=A0A7M2X3T3_9BACT|nr:DUF1501 domain-containing protein [Humisphaera borealis]QOV92324.1 DUF1501 domain-containing protein [Humisphaera borealis]